MNVYTTTCPCGSSQPYEGCCGPFLAGIDSVQSAEQLMRSRYTAFTRGNEAYLLATWHASTRPVSLTLNQPADLRWLGLKIVRTELGQGQDESGTVEFVARYRIAGKGFRQHEVSRFIKEQGRWYYVDGELLKH